MKIGSIVVRCFEFERMLEFWSEALHYIPRERATNGWVVLKDPNGTGPNISLDQVDHKREGKRGWIHLDLYANNMKKETERLIRLGAKKYSWRYPKDADYTVLEDPDGNLFCVVQK